MPAGMPARAESTPAAMPARANGMPAAMPARATFRRQWDEDSEQVFHPLTRAEAEDLRRRQPSVSPWKVVGAQALLGLALAGAAWVLFGTSVAISALYGAAVAVLPGALM